MMESYIRVCVFEIVTNIFQYLVVILYFFSLTCLT